LCNKQINTTGRLRFLDSKAEENLFYWAQNKLLSKASICGACSIKFYLHHAIYLSICLWQMV